MKWLVFWCILFFVVISRHNNNKSWEYRVISNAQHATNVCRVISEDGSLVRDAVGVEYAVRWGGSFLWLAEEARTSSSSSSCSRAGLLDPAAGRHPGLRNQCCWWEVFGWSKADGPQSSGQLPFQGKSVCTSLTIQNIFSISSLNSNQCVCVSPYLSDQK